MSHMWWVSMTRPHPTSDKLASPDSIATTDETWDRRGSSFRVKVRFLNAKQPAAIPRKRAVEFGGWSAFGGLPVQSFAGRAGVPNLRSLLLERRIESAIRRREIDVLAELGRLASTLLALHAAVFPLDR